MVPVAKEPALSTVSLTRSLHVAALERSENDWSGDGLDRLVTLENVRLQVAGASWTTTHRQSAAAGVALATRTLQNCSKRAVTRSWHSAGGRVPETFRWTLDRTLSGATPPLEPVPLPAGITVGDESQIAIPTDVAGGAVSRSRLLVDTLVAEATACSKVRTRLVARSLKEHGLLDLHVLATADAEVTLTDRNNTRGRPLTIQHFRISLVVTLSGSYQAETWPEVEQEHAQLPCDCPGESPCGRATPFDEPFIGPDIVNEPTATSIPPSLPPLSFRAAPRVGVEEHRPALVETTAVRVDRPSLVDDVPEDFHEDTEESHRDLGAVPGIGEASRAKLIAAGIDDVAALAGVDPASLKVSGVGAGRLKRWRDAARALLDG